MDCAQLSFVGFLQRFQKAKKSMKVIFPRVIARYRVSISLRPPPEYQACMGTNLDFLAINPKHRVNSGKSQKMGRGDT